MIMYYGKSTGGWYTKAVIDGQEVGGRRNLTYQQLQEDKEANPMYKWVKDTDTLI